MNLKINAKQEVQRITSFLKQVFKKQNINKAVIGLSGGIDSTTSLLLLTQMLDAKNIFVYHMPYFSRSTKMIDEIVKTTNIPESNYYLIPIKKAFDKLNELINFKTSADTNLRATWEGRTPSEIKGEHAHRSGANSVSSDENIRKGNIMARVRMIVLFDQAKKHHALVCGTENKSEHYLGYFTRFGDNASDFEPLRHLFKTQIFQLAQYLGAPKEVINQPPTAGLWEKQTDEGEFGFTYKEADQVLYYYFDKKISTHQITKMGYANAVKIIDFVNKNKYKHNTPYQLYNLL